MSRIEDLFYIPKENLEDGTEVELPLQPNEKIIIYIDDPISSLDNNHVFFIFSIIEARIAKQSRLHQLFISTHNLDFLKYLKRLTGSGEGCSYLSIEKYRKDIDSRSCIVPMLFHLREYVTEFNYLFQEMYNMYKPVKGDKVKRAENSYTNIYSLPNNIRKFLELYTFYRYPNNDTLMKRLEMMFEGHVPILVNRIVNEFSHLTFIERAWKPFDIPELDEVVNHIFDRMKEIDGKQFSVLLDSCQ
jgi:wobble nucleotide-excising tRNase